MSNSSTIRWSFQKKFIFLFLLSYTFFYIFPFPFDAFPQLDFIFNYYQKVYDVFVIGIGKSILNISDLQKRPFSDSGDTTFHYTQVFIFFILSILLALAIAIFDKKRNNYEKLNAWLFVYIRYCIGFYMLVYGFDKVFKSHFPFPSLEKLEQPFGQSSPQGLLWAFMGYSTPYTIYLGSIEVLSGFLILFRRTHVIGTLLSLIILFNITFINFCYDVPVKLFVLHLLAYTFLLLSPFLNSIFSFFILHTESRLSEQILPVYPQGISKYRKVIKFVVIASFTLLFMNYSITNMRTDGDSAPKPALYGIYKISDSNVKNKKGVTEIIFDLKTTIVKMSDKQDHYETKVDTVLKTIDLRSNSDRSATVHFKYEFDDTHLILIENDSTRMRFMKIDLNKLPLIKRGFHWVVEYPENY